MRFPGCLPWWHDGLVDGGQAFDAVDHGVAEVVGLHFCERAYKNKMRFEQ
jgi:hypothetical protein